MADSRAFGPFLVSWTPATARLAVALMLTGSSLWQGELTSGEPETPLEGEVGASSATGTLQAQFDLTGEHGSLTGHDLIFKAPNFGMTFSGTIGSW
jgi:hypothetical protein